MSTIPDVKLTVLDGGLGIAPATIDGQHVMMGVCSLGVANGFYTISDPQTLVATLGVGPLVQHGSYVLGVAGGPQYFVPINASVAGTQGPVWLAGPNSALKSRDGSGSANGTTVAYQPSAGAAAVSSTTHTGTGVGTMAAAGTPTVNAQVLIKILTTGSNTTATYQYSLDGGVSWTGSVTMTGSDTINGLTVTNTGGAGAFVIGDFYYFTAAVHGPSGTGTIAVAGTAGINSPNFPLGAYDIVIKILSTGTSSTATFTYSLDGGLTYPYGTLTASATSVALAATQNSAGTGLSLVFTGGGGAFVATDIYQSLAVAQSGAGVGTVAVSGAALDGFQVQVKMIAGGTNLAAVTATFQYSLDNGTTFSPTTAVPSGGTYAIASSGLTLTFANGIGSSSTFPAFVAGDIYVFDTLAPGYTNTDLTNAWNAAIANASQFSWMTVIGQAATATASASTASTLSSLATTAATNHNYLFAAMQCAADSDANITTAFASFVDYRVSVCAGFADMQSTVVPGNFVRGSLMSYDARLASIAVSQDPAAFADGPLPGVNAILFDSRIDGALDAARFTTLRTFPSIPGFYICDGFTMETPGGDFSLIQYLRVMNKASRLAYAALLQFLSAKVRVNPSNVQSPLVPGAIDPRDASRVSKFVGNAIYQGVVVTGDASLPNPADPSSCVIVDQTTNILSSQTLNVSIRLIPDGYAKHIVAMIGFQNPAIVLAA